jgi:hypothetical protein
MLCQISDTLFLKHNLYNLNAAFRHEQNQGLLINDALIIDLQVRGIYCKANLNLESFTEHIFIAFPKSINLALNN